MQLYCPRCEGDLEKANHDDYFRDMIWKNAHTWHAKLIAIIGTFAGSEWHWDASWIDPGYLRCKHCNFYTENTPSSYFKPGSVMVPKAIPEFKKVKTSTALIVVFILIALCVGLIILNIQSKN